MNCFSASKRRIENHKTFLYLRYRQQPAYINTQHPHQILSNNEWVFLTRRQSTNIWCKTCQRWTKAATWRSFDIRGDLQTSKRNPESFIDDNEVERMNFILLFCSLLKKTKPQHKSILTHSNEDSVCHMDPDNGLRPPQ